NGLPGPMEYVVNQDEFVVEAITAHIFFIFISCFEFNNDYMKNIPFCEFPSVCPMLTEKSKDEDICMKDANVKRDYVCYTVRGKARFFDLKIEKCMSVSAAAK
ncbi:hypothetical protein BY458DRAFT_445944, partial [Sporodiniella umbellata]